MKENCSGTAELSYTSFGLLTNAAMCSIAFGHSSSPHPGPASDSVLHHRHATVVRNAADVGPIAPSGLRTFAASPGRALQDASSATILSKSVNTPTALCRPSAKHTHNGNGKNKNRARKAVKENCSGTVELSWTSFGLLTNAAMCSAAFGGSSSLAP